MDRSTQKPIGQAQDMQIVDDVVLEKIIENKVIEVLNRSREDTEELNYIE